MRGAARNARVRTQLKSFLENRMPWLFARLCPWVDARAARDPQSDVQLLPLLVAPGETVCDIGANRGLFVYWLLQSGARVLAFEPNPRLTRILRLRFPAQIADGTLTLYETALGAEAGEATLHVPRGHSPLATIDGNLAGAVGNPMDDVRVPLARLDDLVSGPVGFIKLDVEGHELKVLEGARRLLTAHRPSLLVEAEERHRPGAVAAVRALLEPLGYEGFFRLDGRMEPIAAFDPARHQPATAVGPDGINPVPGVVYVLNFVFAARPAVVARLAGWRR